MVENSIDTSQTGFSIRGGGTRGAGSAGFLEQFFADNPSLRDRVAVWGGTSTGGCIALGYAAGMDPVEITKIYSARSREIFKSRGIRDFFFVDELRRANYDNKGLIRVMRETFGDMQIGDLKVDIAIPTVDLATEGQGVCRAMPVLITRQTHAELPVWKAAVMTSSAPTYFPSFEGYVDGGIAANNPCLLTYGVLRKKTSDPRILDIGNGAMSRQIPGRDLDYGLVKWGAKGLIPLILQMTERSTAQCAQSLLGRRYREVDWDLGEEVALDNLDQIERMIEAGKEHARINGQGIARWMKRV
jgi:predicted acylesterase/phospholipase RssA